MAIKLKGIPGQQPTIPVSELKVGDTILWDAGLTSVVLSIEPRGKSSYAVTMTANGNTYHRIYKGSRLAVVKQISSVNVCKTAQELLESHKANIRPVTLKERTEAYTDAQRQANYILSIGNEEYYTTGTIEDIKTVIKTHKSACNKGLNAV